MYWLFDRTFNRFDGITICFASIQLAHELYLWAVISIVVGGFVSVAGECILRGEGEK